MTDGRMHIIDVRTATSQFHLSIYLFTLYFVPFRSQMLPQRHFIVLNAWPATSHKSIS